MRNKIKKFENFNTESFKKIYFAHPISTYGTNIEKESISILEENGFDVLNPGAKEQQDDFIIFRKNNPNDYMKYFDDLVLRCDSFAYLPFRDDKIGAGIVYESDIASKNNMKIYKIDLINRIIIEVDFDYILKNRLSVDETRHRIRNNIF